MFDILDDHEASSESLPERLARPNVCGKLFITNHMTVQRDAARARTRTRR